MTGSALANRQIVVVGAQLAALARSSIPDARLSLISPEEALATPTALAADLVIIDAASAPSALLADLIAAIAALKPAPPTLLIGAHLPTGLVRALLKLERSDVLEAPFALSDLAGIAAELIAAGASATRAKSRCWSVIGAVGGAGATTVAVEMASLLAKRSGLGQTCLVDLNLADGAAAAYLGATPNFRLAHASASPNRLDVVVLQAFTFRTPGGPDLLAAPRDPLAFHSVDPAAIRRILEVACETYSWVVIDLPRQHQSWTLDVLAGSDEVLVVSELTVPALLAAKALTAEIEDALAGVTRPRVVLNRISGRTFGASPSVAEAERALQRKADAAISSDWEAASASVNLGGAICRHRPRSKIVRDVQALIDRMAPGEVAAPRLKKRLGR